jgi:hypothetical protein
MEKNMLAQEKAGGNATRPSRRQMMIGTGTLAAATMGLAPWSLAQSARGFGAASFAPYIGQGFLVTGAKVNTALRLIKVKSYPRSRRPAWLPDPFSLIFRDVADTGPLPDEIVEIEHAGIGRISIFLHPITRNLSYYEADFN